jgi:riboflavin biosynthesis pyrimidine reductase
VEKLHEASLTTAPRCRWWSLRNLRNTSPTQALEKGVKKFGSNVLVEGGATFIFELIKERALDGIYLSISPVTGGESRIDYEELLENFSEVTHREVEGTQFYQAQNLKI